MSGSRCFTLALAAVLWVLVAACSSDSHAGPQSTTTSAERSTTTTTTTVPTSSTGCRHPEPLAAGISEHTLSDGTVDRPYELVVPAHLDPQKPHPLVLGLHALTVSYKFIPSMSGIDTMVDRYDFIGVIPSGRLNGSTPYWNAAPTDDNYDVAFIGSLLDHLEDGYCVDPSQVFSLGMSNGAQMSSLLACRMPDRIRAIGPISGEEYLTPCNGRPVAIIAFHGTADPIVKYGGGGLNATHITDMEYWHGKVPPDLPAPMGIDESMRLWAKHNGCDPRPSERRLTDEVRLRRWTGCSARTELYIIDGGGHAWPGKPEPAFEAQFGHGTTDIDASDLIFRFFFGRS
ncbi:MAG: hypothetical protein JO291_12380 [Acidimicrobiia bacterium]|nr:hypothetical protein [Acidimicrobiia bacterium]